MSELAEKQWRFVKMVALLVQYADLLGYKLTYSQTYRTPSEAKQNAAAGTGISNSLHTQRLAVDFNLFIDGKYRQDTEAHKPLGDFWKLLGGAWGGDFKDSAGRPKPDGNHYSLPHRGVK